MDYLCLIIGKKGYLGNIGGNEIMIEPSFRSKRPGLINTNVNNTVPLSENNIRQCRVHDPAAIKQEEFQLLSDPAVSIPVKIYRIDILDNKGYIEFQEENEEIIQQLIKESFQFFSSFKNFNSETNLFDPISPDIKNYAEWRGTECSADKLPKDGMRLAKKAIQL